MGSFPYGEKKQNKTADLQYLEVIEANDDLFLPPWT